MSIKEKLQSVWNTVIYTPPVEMTYRGYRTIVNGDQPAAPQPPQELRPIIKSLLVGVPWWIALFVAYLYWLSTSGQIAPDSIKYGIFKTALAVVLTMVADFSLFFTAGSRRDQAYQNMRLIARAVVFLGVCWMLSIA